MIEKIKQLREETGAGILDVKNALSETDGDVDSANEFLKKKGLATADKKVDREAREGLIHSYIHGNGTVGSMIELRCETDFVARTDEFEELANELAMQVAAMNPESREDFLEQDYIRDTKRTIEDLIKDHIAKLGENIYVERFVRYELGEVEVYD